MFEALPERLDLLREADRGRAFRGRLALRLMERLSAVVRGDEGEAEVELRFEREGGHAVIEGRVAARVRLTCQRCLEAVELELDQPLHLALVQGEEEAQRLPERLDPLLVGDEPVAVALRVEEELLLALPAVPRHDRCHPVAATPEPAPDAHAEPRRENPFAVLAQLKGRPRGGE